jgi:signal transduction histidine kinase
MNRRVARKGPPELPIISLSLRNESDIVLVRQRARVIAELFGFNRVDQTRIATAVSEIARNAVQHGRGGKIRYSIAGTAVRALQIDVEDSGSGLELREPESERELPRVGEGGAGIALSRRLMDSFEVAVRPEGGAHVRMSKALPPGRQETGPEDVRGLIDELLRRPPESLIEELYQQQQELLAVLEDLTARQEALRQMNVELEETNRGVMALYAQVAQELDETNRGVLALYAQLDDQTRSLQRVNSLKDHFISHLSHEFRTPLNSALALSRLLLDRADGPLNPEQERQVGFIHEGARELLEMVNDLLDLAKIEAGRLDVNPEEFGVEEVFSALRGMFRPLAADRRVELVFADPPADWPLLLTDKQKVGQILRNLISNALKFTVTGEVRVQALRGEPDAIVFEVADTGIGIPADQLDRIFEEFTQVPGPQQREVRGTGLGLPLSVKLAALLGGSISAESTPGKGSTFRLRVPWWFPAGAEPTTGSAARRPAAGEQRAAPQAPPGPPFRAGQGPTGPVVLVVDDDEASRYLVEHTLAPTGCIVLHAATGEEGIRVARQSKPGAIFLDLGLPDMSGLDVLRELKADLDIGDRPVIVYTARQLQEDEKHLLTGFALSVVRKDDPALGQALGSIGAALARATEERAGNGEG